MSTPESPGFSRGEHVKVPSSANREERALGVAMDAIDRVLALSDHMGKAPDALTRAWARRIAPPAKN